MEILYEEDYPEGYDYYEAEAFIKNIRDLDIPERNIFCGYQFHDAPIKELSRQEFNEYCNREEEESSSDFHDDYPF